MQGLKAQLAAAGAPLPSRAPQLLPAFPVSQAADRAGQAQDLEASLQHTVGLRWHLAGLPVAAWQDKYLLPARGSGPDRLPDCAAAVGNPHSTLTTSSSIPMQALACEAETQRLLRCICLTTGSSRSVSVHAE